MDLSEKQGFKVYPKSIFAPNTRRQLVCKNMGRRRYDWPYPVPGYFVFYCHKSGHSFVENANNPLRQKLIAIFSGMIGIYMASYGNGILGQMPTGILMYMGWAFLFMKNEEKTL